MMQDWEFLILNRNKIYLLRKSGGFKGLKNKTHLVPKKVLVKDPKRGYYYAVRWVNPHVKESKTQTESGSKKKQRVRKISLVKISKVGKWQVGVSKVEDADDVAQIFKDLALETREKFMALFVDKEKKPIATAMLAAGTIDMAPFPGLYFVQLLKGLKRAKGLWLVHNHPSGIPSPSEADINVTKEIANISKTINGPKVLGHVVIGESQYALIPMTSEQQPSQSYMVLNTREERKTKRATGFKETKRKKGQELSVVEARFKKRPEWLWKEQIRSPREAYEIVKRHKELLSEGVTFLFLDVHLRLLGVHTFPFPSEGKDYSKLMKDVISCAAKFNSNQVAILSGKKPTAEENYEFNMLFNYFEKFFPKTIGSILDGFYLTKSDDGSYHLKSKNDWSFGKDVSDLVKACFQRLILNNVLRKHTLFEEKSTLVPKKILVNDPKRGPYWAVRWINPQTKEEKKLEIGAVHNLPVSAIERNPDQPRKKFDPDALRELADSIKKIGLRQPIVVRPHPTEPGKFQIVAGERRWRAHKLAGLKTIRAIVEDLSDEQAAEIALMENITRQNLTPLEEAKAYSQMIENGWTPERLAEVTGQTPGTILRKLNITQLRPEIQKIVGAKGGISASHAVEIGRLPLHLQGKAVRKVGEERLSVEETRALVNALLAQENQMGLFAPEKKETKMHGNKARALRNYYDRMINSAEKLINKVISNKDYKLLPWALKGDLNKEIKRLKMIRKALNKVIAMMEEAQRQKELQGEIKRESLSNYGQIGEKLKRKTRKIAKSLAFSAKKYAAQRLKKAYFSTLKVLKAVETSKLRPEKVLVHDPKKGTYYAVRWKRIAGEEEEKGRRKGPKVREERTGSESESGEFQSPIFKEVHDILKRAAEEMHFEEGKLPSNHMHNFYGQLERMKILEPDQKYAVEKGAHDIMGSWNLGDKERLLPVMVIAGKVLNNPKKKLTWNPKRFDRFAKSNYEKRLRRVFISDAEEDGVDYLIKEHPGGEKEGADEFLQLTFLTLMALSRAFWKRANKWPNSEVTARVCYRGFELPQNISREHFIESIIKNGGKTELNANILSSFSELKHVARSFDTGERGIVVQKPLTEEDVVFYHKGIDVGLGDESEIVVKRTPDVETIWFTDLAEPFPFEKLDVNKVREMTQNMISWHEGKSHYDKLLLRLKIAHEQIQNAIVREKDEKRKKAWREFLDNELSVFIDEARSKIRG